MKLADFRLFALLALGLLPFGANSLESDRNQPIQIEANGATFNEKSGTSVYTGNVKVVQGSIRLWADRLTVYADNGSMEKMLATGKPVKFRQTPDYQGEDIQGNALTVEYYGKTARLIMLKEAKLWQGKNVTTSERIEYDSRNSIIQAGKKSSGSQRVKVILQPKRSEK